MSAALVNFEDLISQLKCEPRTWLITGVAGFIGSHLLEALLQLDQRVIGIDNLSTGFLENLADVEARVGAVMDRFTFIKGDICDAELVTQAMKGVSVVLHQAALGSVPRSVADPIATHRANVDGHLVVLNSARAEGVARFVYASSSSIYGDNDALPKKEEFVGTPLSPYAASKRAAELYGMVFDSVYDLHTIALRYFNVFGPRQNPEGAYAAVIPRWIQARLEGKPCEIYGDGTTSRDFSYVTNIVRANILSALAPTAACRRAYNIACSQRTSLIDLYRLIESEVQGGARCSDPIFREGRRGDVKHSHADISSARNSLGYEPTVNVVEGLKLTVEWYRARPFKR